MTLRTGLLAGKKALCPGGQALQREERHMLVPTKDLPLLLMNTTASHAAERPCFYWVAFA